MQCKKPGFLVAWCFCRLGLLSPSHFFTFFTLYIHIEYIYIYISYGRRVHIEIMNRIVVRYIYQQYINTVLVTYNFKIHSYRNFRKKAWVCIVQDISDRINTEVIIWLNYIVYTVSTTSKWHIQSLIKIKRRECILILMVPLNLLKNEFLFIILLKALNWGEAGVLHSEIPQNRIHNIHAASFSIALQYSMKIPCAGAYLSFEISLKLHWNIG